MISRQARTLAGFGDDEAPFAPGAGYPDQAAVLMRNLARDEQGVELVWEIQVLDSGLVRQKAEVRNIGSWVIYFLCSC